MPLKGTFSPISCTLKEHDHVHHPYTPAFPYASLRLSEIRSSTLGGFQTDTYRDTQGRTVVIRLVAQLSRDPFNSKHFDVFSNARILALFSCVVVLT